MVCKIISVSLLYFCIGFIFGLCTVKRTRIAEGDWTGWILFNMTLWPIVIGLLIVGCYEERRNREEDK